MAFWTDYQGNILDTAARPLSSFQDDPRPRSRWRSADETWDFGTAQQGTLMQRQVHAGSVGYMDLLTHLRRCEQCSVAGPAAALGAAARRHSGLHGDAQHAVPAGRSRSRRRLRCARTTPRNPTKTITIRGDVTPMPEDAPGGATLRPLDVPVTVTGNQGDWVEFSHTLGPEPSSLHPVKVYSQDYSTLKGVGKYATSFGQGTASYDTFGDGHDGPKIIATDTVDVPIDAPCSGTVGSDVLTAANESFAQFLGRPILIHQSRGAGAGTWMKNRIIDYSSGTVTLALPLNAAYISSGNSRAQVLVLREYADVTVNAGATWSAKAWNGETGGLLAFLSTGTLTVNGRLIASEKGFRSQVGSSSETGMQGEGTVGSGGYSTAANGSGGGGGMNGYDPYCDASGGGGGHAFPGANGITQGPYSGGAGGQSSGASDMSSMSFGGAGGQNGDAGRYQLYGGNGGGIVFVGAASINVNDSTGFIASDGESARTPWTSNCANSGGGAGGSVFLTGYTASLGANRVTASGGIGGEVGPGNGSRGGNGSVGRIRIEYCEVPPTFSTIPPSSTQELNCYIVEQVESVPYDHARLNLPESGTNTHQVQFGRRFIFTDALQSAQFIRMPKQLYTTADLDVLVSNAGVASGSLDLSLDIGDDGTADWTYSNASTTFPTNFTITSLANALNAYMVHQPGAAWGADIDVPMKVMINRKADVILTNLVLTLQSNQPGAAARGLGRPRRRSTPRLDGERAERAQPGRVVRVHPHDAARTADAAPGEGVQPGLQQAVGCGKVRGGV